MSNGVNLPVEIVVYILSRLPAKPLGRSRCVSKSWRSILSHPEFIKTHLNRNNHSKKIVLVSDSHSLYSVDFDQRPSVSNGAVATKLNFDHSDNWIDVVGSCDGLLLVLDEEDNIFLLNPTTRELKKLTNSPCALCRPGSFSMYGLGYDSSTDDYKVIVLSYWDTDNEYEPDIIDTFVDVYTLRANCWRRLQSSPYDHAVPDLAPGALLNGSLHWLTCKSSDYSSVIAAFSLENEKFSEVAPPGELDKQKFVFNNLLVVEGFLCILVSRSQYEKTDLWIMKEYGNGDSWTELTLSESRTFTMRPLRLFGEEEVVMEIDGERLVLYNARAKALINLEINGIPTMFETKGTFVESLVSPNCVDGIDAHHETFKLNLQTNEVCRF